jgi:hypothetical protein
MASVRSVNAPCFTLRPHFHSLRSMRQRRKTVFRSFRGVNGLWRTTQSVSATRGFVSNAPSISPLPENCSQPNTYCRRQGELRIACGSTEHRGSWVPLALKGGRFMTPVAATKKQRTFDLQTFLSTVDGGRTIATFPDKRMIFCSGRPGGCCFLYTVRAK